MVYFTWLYEEYGYNGQSSSISGILDLKQPWNPLHSTSQPWFIGIYTSKLIKVGKVLCTPVSGQGGPYGP